MATGRLSGNGWYIPTVAVGGGTTTTGRSTSKGVIAKGEQANI